MKITALVENRAGGKLKPVQVPGRDRLNPRTGEKVFVPAHLKVVFRPSKTFSERLN